MSGVHKSDRGESRFEVMDHAVLLKKKLRELSILRNFGYTVRQSKLPRNFEQWSEPSRERWKQQEANRMQKLQELDRYFLANKRAEVDEDIKRLMHSISAANCIRPSCMAEADERRLHQDRAIAACEDLRLDLTDIMDTLPINKNWMTHVEPDIAAQIALLKAWRKSDNEMRRSIREADAKRWMKFIQNMTEDNPKNDLVQAVFQAYLDSMERRGDPEGPVAP